MEKVNLGGRFALPGSLSNKRGDGVPVGNDHPSSALPVALDKALPEVRDLKRITTEEEDDNLQRHQPRKN